MGQMHRFPKGSAWGRARYGCRLPPRGLLLSMHDPTYDSPAGYESESSESREKQRQRGGDRGGRNIRDREAHAAWLELDKKLMRQVRPASDQAVGCDQSPSEIVEGS